MPAVTYVGSRPEVYVPAVNRVVARGETIDVPADVAGVAPVRPGDVAELADLGRLVESLRINDKDHATAVARLRDVEREVAGAGLLAQVDNWKAAEPAPAKPAKAEKE